MAYFIEKQSVQEFWNETLQRIKARAESADEEVESADHVDQDVSPVQRESTEGEPADRRSK